LTARVPEQLPRHAIQAELEPGSFDAKARTVRVVWSTGARVRFWDFSAGEYDLTLGLEPKNVDLDFARQGAPVLNAHRSYSAEDVVGVVEKIGVDGTRGTATLRFSKRPDVQPIVQDVADGVLRFVSVGTRLRKLRDITEKGDEVPHYFAELHEPLEISLAPIPKDRGAVMQTEGAERFPVSIARKEPTMPEPIIIDPKQPAAPDAVTLAERARVSEIVQLVDKAKLPHSLALTLIEKGKSLDQARDIILSTLAEQSDSLQIRSGISPIRDEADKRREFTAAAGEALGSRGAFVKISAQAESFVGWPIVKLTEECIRRNGQRFPSFSADKIVTQALHSTSDFPEILANAFGKRLRMGYDAAVGGVQALAKQSSARDFRAKRSVILGEAPELLLVTENGEFKRGTMAEAGESYSLATFGRIFAISRQALVNDDLDAFSQAAQAFGAAARERERSNLAALVTSNPNMADGVPVFHATHGNLAASGGALSVTTLGAARLAMRKQKGVDGVTPIEMAPTSLLVPAALETPAEQVLASIAAATVDDANPFSQKLELVVDARLDAASATAWYLVARSAEGLEYAYLEGQQGVQVFTREGFDVDGLEIKARLDFGAGWIDWRSWYKNAGA
jgi:hypothetical protein